MLRYINLGILFVTLNSCFVSHLDIKRDFNADEKNNYIKLCEIIKKCSSDSSTKFYDATDKLETWNSNNNSEISFFVKSRNLVSFKVDYYKRVQLLLATSRKKTNKTWEEEYVFYGYSNEVMKNVLSAYSSEYNIIEQIELGQNCVYVKVLMHLKIHG